MSQPAIANQQLVWDQAILNKYNYSGPRYTSYPTALEFHEAFTIADYDRACTEYPQRPLSLYIHIPFCHKLCYYCGCNKTITRQTHKADQYLDVLELEIRTRAALLKGRKITQLHFGGGTPTFLTTHQISRLMTILRGEFLFQPDAEISIEVDPREIKIDMLDHLRQEGFNRLSIGVQDFNKEVQKRVNREQDEAFIFALVERAKQLGFRSTNLDLIYGLPKQTKASFAETVRQVLTMKPERLSVFNYAHMPQLFAAQRRIKEEDLPQPEEKMAIFQDTIATLTEAKYQFIGMDHFAQSDDELAVAQREGKLHRNFQGYTTQGEADLVGFGVSAISMVGHAYAQNQKELKTYYSQVNEKHHALFKGVLLDSDDLLRREVIKQLICNFKLDKVGFEDAFSVKFDHYFAQDLSLLQNFVDDQLVEINEQEISVTLRGRLLIRNICMCFDKYLRVKTRQQQFSRVI
ncbi:oxygen-independent coproporphyrinogen III oxidase [Vibrio ostreicida]|uniref:Coproporphyrinogen-III oxidase n=1 Tax=Vibrio ostreicida TaxID=526588 RepID=A0ABT8BNG1_9VIBR|nr:oxygen-independent coproporphyrinogen III oxidase [Vibrio ostreicida]MDN3608702.1 oxygen-independent coproporphyrinogen III oxidase [Vibrio ostreicida]NPD10615.1 oxygen-independent coproporphyrinogen III oxidase [Vibrio ostreicida]